ncbi:hypothetical protein N7492_004723 [Penicillium capsulatum]|uniref:HNH nuclease domain-containing protein n=1 Tax=Penicillium capsulatum TaxID=69766 RepID=A0A9W9IB03_9EURO|nr:hypothetical protein N7492_004723 [Penicillium capsulatum]KAJ6136172.1 hypothetical protein N7512_001332 [Penicillium capsulatum]
MPDTPVPFLLPPFLVPERISSLVTPERRQAMREQQQRSVSAASRLSEASMSSAASTASNFLDAKIAALENETTYIACVKEGLTEAALAGNLKDPVLQRELAPLISQMRSTASTLSILKRQRSFLVEDLEDAVASKRQRLRQPSDDGLLERAYRDTIIPRVMNASAKQRAKPFDQRRFKKEVNRYYGLKEHCAKHMSWCQVLGLKIPKPNVKAAHIVPKSLIANEVAHIFGAGEVVLSDPRNALSLYSGIEGLLDEGVIAVVPIPGRMTAPTAWRCVVLDESKGEDDVYDHGNGVTTRVKDLDGRVLQFLNDNRPCRRYLYFRFIISYLQAKKLQLTDVTEKVEAKRFWPSEGAYLHKSTLKILARCVSGCELPDDLTENTFEDSIDPARDNQAGMIMAADLQDDQPATVGPDQSPDPREALIESLKEL